jgi:antitoxin component YwqK of YwqJK toxin-antitoxin module
MLVAENNTERQYNNMLILETTYYDNGNIHYETPILNGCIHGTQKVYDEDGVLCMEINWVSDELHGYIYSYDKNGRTIQVDLYRYNSLIDMVSYD